MPVKLVTPKELAGTLTLIKEFMLERSKFKKTYSDLVAIFDKSEPEFTKNPELDKSRDLRVLRYYSDMREGRWKGNIYVPFHNGEAEGAIHRGIAYLKCINDGVSPSDLPRLFLED